MRMPVALEPIRFGSSASTRAAVSASTLARRPASGKTYRMLAEAHGLVSEKVDVVIGYIETHGRAETAAMLAGLEEVPRREVTYRGVVLEEMDVDAIVARHPQVALVDELAHTNVPGSKHRKRWEDVLELLDAGIDVVTAVNVQHLESLNDVVATDARRHRPRDGARLGGRARRPRRQHRSRGGGSAPAAARGEDLRTRQDSGGARELLHRGESHDAARARAARGRELRRSHA